MKAQLRILVVEDSEDDMILILNEIKKGEYDIIYERIEDENGFRTALENNKWDIILSDYSLPGFNGIEALKIFSEYNIEIPFIIISGVIGEEVAVEAMRKGAQDYLIKNNIKRLLPVIERELQEAKNRVKLKQYEEKQKEAETLKISEEKFKHLVSHMPVGIILQNVQGEILVYNKKAFEFSDLTIDQISGKVPFHPSWNVISENDYKFQGFNVLFESVVKERIPKLDLVLGIFHPAKSKRVWLNLDIIPLFDNNGELIQVLWTFIDRTERKEAIDALKENEELYRSILNASPDNITIADHKGKILGVSPCALDMFGYANMNEMLGRSIMDFIASSDIKKALSIIEKLVHGDKPGLIEFIGLKKDGRYFDVEVNGEIIKNKDNQLTKVVLVIRDITKRRQVEIEMLKLTKTVEQSPMSIVITNPEGIIEYVNPYFTNITGYSKEEAIGKTPRILKSGKTPLTVYKQLWNSIKSGNIWRGEFCNVNKKGDIYWESASISPLKNSNGQITHYIGIKEDITKRKTIENEIKEKNEELTKLNLEKDKFFSIIAHDLRSPFSTFLGMTNLLEKKLSSISSDQLLQFIIMLNSSANELYQLLENLLQWANAQQGAFQFNPEPLNLTQTIKKSISPISTSAKEKKLTIKLSIDENLEIKADLNMFQTIIRNLISNAVKFTPPHGKIVISAIQVNKELVEISIKDTGIGMDDTILSNLFKLGAKINRNGTEGEPSSGLGLLLCKDFVEKHNGKIWAESTEQKGTTFYFTVKSN